MEIFQYRILLLFGNHSIMAENGTIHQRDSLQNIYLLWILRTRLLSWSCMGDNMAGFERVPNSTRNQRVFWALYVREDDRFTCLPRAWLIFQFSFLYISQFLLDLFRSASFKSYHDEGLFFTSGKIYPPRSRCYGLLKSWTIPALPL